MANTLVFPVDLTPFPGAPFSDTLTDVAAAAVRAEAGWHIAPIVAETVTFDSYGGTMLNLPTRRVVSITSVVDSAGYTYTGFTRVGAALHRYYGWPIGQVTITWSHGYAETPVELLPVLADRARGASSGRDPQLASVTVGQVSETYRSGMVTQGARGGTVMPADPVVARYALLAGVA